MHKDLKINKFNYPETLSIHTIENFIGIDDVNKLIKLCNKGLEEANVDFGKSSVHTSDKFTTKKIASIYEPNGRSEFGKLSNNITEILDDAIKQNLHLIQNIFPNVKRALPWNYVEYKLNQYCTSHVDYICKTELNEIVYAGIGIMLKTAKRGGEFYTETTGSPNFIINGEAAPDLNYSNKKFVNMPKTKWVIEQSIGTAVLYGSQTIHGTNPVKQGKCYKLISWLAG